MKTINSHRISPDYQRIPHFNKEISNMTHDDIELESEIEFPFHAYVQEKVDGANMGVSWYNGSPILRNRNHILKKGYSKIRTPAKQQFRSAWNWIHDHSDDIEFVSDEVKSPITIYGEWMYFKHSIEYDKLPGWFIAYDIWSLYDNDFLSPKRVESILSITKIPYIRPLEVTFNSIKDIVEYSERKSEYRDGLMEGIVIKTANELFLESSFKVVNKYFERREDFNTSDIRKNSIIKR